MPKASPSCSCKRRTMSQNEGDSRNIEGLNFKKKIESNFWTVDPKFTGDQIISELSGTSFYLKVPRMMIPPIKKMKS